MPADGAEEPPGCQVAVGAVFLEGCFKVTAIVLTLLLLLLLLAVVGAAAAGTCMQASLWTWLSIKDYLHVLPSTCNVMSPAACHTNMQADTRSDDDDDDDSDDFGAGDDAG